MELIINNGLDFALVMIVIAMVGLVIFYAVKDYYSSPHIEIRERRKRYKAMVARIRANYQVGDTIRFRDPYHIAENTLFGKIQAFEKYDLLIHINPQEHFCDDEIIGVEYKFIIEANDCQDLRWFIERSKATAYHE